VRDFEIYKLRFRSLQLLSILAVAAGMFFLFAWEASLIRTEMGSGQVAFWAIVGVGLFCLIALNAYTAGGPWGRIFHRIDERGFQYRNWRGALRSIAWGDVTAIDFVGDRWEYGPFSRHLSNGSIVLAAGNERARVDLGNYKSPRSVLNAVMGSVTEASPDEYPSLSPENWAKSMESFVDDSWLSSEFLQRCERGGISAVELSRQLKKRALYLLVVPFLVGFVATSIFVATFASGFDLSRDAAIGIVVSALFGQFFSKGLVRTWDLALVGTSDFAELTDP